MGQAPRRLWIWHYHVLDRIPRIGAVQRGAVLYNLEGDLGFSAANSGSNEVGHEVKVVNFLDSEDGLVSLNIARFAKNNTGDQAFITGDCPLPRSGRVGVRVSL